MIKNFFEKLKHLIASIFKDVPSLLAFEAVIATVLYTILFFRSEKDKISYLSLAFAFVSFAFTLNDSNKASKETKELNKSIQRLNSLLQENKTINSIETQEVACKEDFDNKTKLNDKTKIILFIIFFIFIIPFIVNYIVDIPSPFGFINDSNKEIWIPFLGTIIGGSITLFGVWWTIDNQKKQRRIDLAIQYRPFFRPIVPMKIDGNSFEENAFPSNSTEHSFETNYTKDIIVKIKNSGRGEAIIKDITNDISISQTDKIRVRVNNDLNDCIFPKQYFKLELNITIYDYKCLKSSDMYYDFPITIEYTDFFKTKQL